MEKENGNEMETRVYIGDIYNNNIGIMEKQMNYYLGFRDLVFPGLGYRVSWFRVSCIGFRDSGFRVQGSGFGV